jgi:hypothetical protein
VYRALQLLQWDRDTKEPRNHIIINSMYEFIYGWRLVTVNGPSSNHAATWLRGCHVEMVVVVVAIC